MKVLCDDNCAPQWFAIHVWSGREHLCANHLRQRGYEVFLPCIRERRRWSDRIKVVDRPLFPGYVFCRFGDDVVGKIITAPGVIRIVGDDRGPSAILAQEIETVRCIVDAQLSVEPWPAPSLVGQRVLIELGPLRGITGTVLVVKNRRRLVVSVGLVPEAIAVEIDSDWITTPLAPLATPHAERQKRSGAA